MPTTPEPVGSVLLGWSQIKQGDHVLGARDGARYAVTRIVRSGEETRVDLMATESQATFKAVAVSGAVRRVATAAEAHERALASVQVILGGTVVATRAHGDERGHATPTTFVDTAAYAAHLLLFHSTALSAGGPTGPLTYADVDGEHRALHHDIDAGNPKPGTVVHFHDPDFDTRSA